MPTVVRQVVGMLGSENTPVAAHEQTDACLVMPQLPYLPDAELAGMGGHVHSLTILPYPAFFYYGIYLFIKGLGDKLAQREAVLSLHREKLFDATAYYRCQPVCEYYIFALRRILI